MRDRAHRVTTWGRRPLRSAGPLLWAVVILAGLVPGAPRLHGQAPRPAVSVSAGPDGRLVYTSDPQGTRVIDFSHAGYGGGGRALPNVPAVIAVTATGRRDRERIQAALDLVAARPPDARGFRGAVVLARGRFVVEGDLRIAASGVVLRGSGSDDDGTIIEAAGTSRRALLTLAGTGSRQELSATRVAITDTVVPAGATTITVADPRFFAAGHRVVVHRPSTAEWIAALGMNAFQGWRPENRLHWQPGSRDLDWEREVVAVDGARVTLSAPITTALEQRFGGGWIARCTFPGRVAQSGIEDLRLVSAYDRERPWDEDHAWVAVAIDKAEDVWVRNVAARHFAGSAVSVEADALRVTVEDVDAAEPISEIGGYRRRVFYAAGQLTLFRRCRSAQGQHDFVAGFAAAGPNVFLQSSASGALDYSGPLESWASGVLYDSVVIRGNALRLTNRGTADQGQGWAAANSVLWNSEATDIEVQSPPGAVNQAYGCKGLVTGDGVVWDPRTMPFRDFYRGMPVAPASLYLTQLHERLGQGAIDAIETARTLPADAGTPLLADAEVAAWSARQRERTAGPKPAPLRVERGRFMIGNEPAWTARTSYSWFQGQMPRTLAPAFGPAITRFAPGKVGPGWTDDLEAMAAGLAPRSVFYQHYGLWYDRRRVDHNYYGSNEQRTGDVWPPFMELPWARSGLGKAWDGLSKYDLTRFNPWYFDRLKAFADIADRRGLVLYHHFYFQHWLLESRSHYVDFPWRPFNTIQLTGLPDEVPAARVFYDIEDPARRELHRAYIRRALDTFVDNTNVVHGIDREYTGPLTFVQFWLDTIAEWQAEHGKPLFVSLEIPKDQMDAILEDPVRGRLISAIDVLGWVYRADGALFATRGDLDRAPRQQRPDIATPLELDQLKQKLSIPATDQTDFLNGPEFQRLFDTLWASSKPMKYRGWREYRDRFPHVVTLWNGDEYPSLTAAIERQVPPAVRSGARPVDLVVTPKRQAWALAEADRTILVYVVAGEPVTLALGENRNRYRVRWIDVDFNEPVAAPDIKARTSVTLTPPPQLTGKPTLVWLTRIR